MRDEPIFDSILSEQVNHDHFGFVMSYLDQEIREGDVQSHWGQRMLEIYRAVCERHVSPMLESYDILVIAEELGYNPADAEDYACIARAEHLLFEDHNLFD